MRSLLATPLAGPRATFWPASRLGHHLGLAFRSYTLGRCSFSRSAARACLTKH